MLKSNPFLEYDWSVIYIEPKLKRFEREEFSAVGFTLVYLLRPKQLVAHLSLPLGLNRSAQLHLSMGAGPD